MKNWMIILILMICQVGVSQVVSFGQNRVQYKDFNWRFIQSKHFDIYFYSGGETLAEYTAEIAEPFYEDIVVKWKYELDQRISLFVYNSHKDFQTSLIVDSDLPEAVGGVTELYKNRIIIPYQGDYKKFEHVIRHELIHGIMNDILYDASVQSLISRRVTQPPLWFSEGLAEWEATGWNTQMDMVIRDMVINNYIPPIEYLQYYSPYQGGSNVFKYISERFGREKVAEFLKRVKGNYFFGDAFESAIGLTYEKFNEDWHRSLKKQYWPEIQNRKEPAEIAQKLTDHTKDRSYINSSPTISPNGDVMAYLSNQYDSYMSIYLVDMFTGEVIKRLIKGNTSNAFESMHWLSPGMSFSPDGKTLAFSAKGGDQDILYFVDVKSGDVSRKDFEQLEGIFDASYSPDGKYLAFVGQYKGASDIYIYEFENDKLINLTNDVFTDIDPSWSPDGSKIAFVSDRRDVLSGNIQPYEIKMHTKEIDYKNIYTVSVKDQFIERITTTDAVEGSPVFSPDGDIIAFSSDRNGISNIYFKNISTNEAEYPVTDLLTGAYQLEWSKDGQELLFSSFYNQGYDIYTIHAPLQLKPLQELTKTSFMKNKDSEPLVWTPSTTTVSNDDQINALTEESSLAKFNFAKLSRKYSEENTVDKANVFLKEEEVKYQGKYKVRDYESKWSMDFVNAATSYDSFYGLRGFYLFNFSDYSGAHRLTFYSNLILNFRNADVIVNYAYMPEQINYYFSVFHLANQFGSSFGGAYYTYRQYGASASMSRPFNRFYRADLNVQYVNYGLSRSGDFKEEESGALIGSLSLVHDNTKWSFTGPADGTRWNITATLAPDISSNLDAFRTLKFDFRRYFEIGNGFSFATRLSAGTSYGLREDEDGNNIGAQKFRIGGVNYWLFNTKYKQSSGRSSYRPEVSNVSDLAYTEFVTPLRGAYYNEQEGRNYVISNLEFRFPFIDYLIVRVPPLPFQGIRAAFFTDIGSAFDNWGTFRGYKNGSPHDLIVGYGYGIQAYIPFLGGIFRFDKAWRSLPGDDSAPIYYYSFGVDF